MELKEQYFNKTINRTFLFLIHRVELKVEKVLASLGGGLKVSNSPCGVESKSLDNSVRITAWFLIHRVELKALLSHQYLEDTPSF